MRRPSPLCAAAPWLCSIGVLFLARGVWVVGVRVVGVWMMGAACWVPGGAGGAVASSTGWALRCRSSSVERGRMICQFIVVLVSTFLCQVTVVSQLPQHVHTDTHMLMPIFPHKNTCSHTHTQMFTHTYSYTHLLTHTTHTHLLAHTHTPAHTHLLTHTHSHTPTQTHIHLTLQTHLDTRVY